MTCALPHGAFSDINKFSQRNKKKQAQDDKNPVLASFGYEQIYDFSLRDGPESIPRIGVRMQTAKNVGSDY